MEMTNKDSHDLKHQTTALPVNPLRASVGVTTAAEGGPNLLMATATECYRCSGKHKYSQEGLHRWHVLPNVARDTLRFDNRMHDKSLWLIHQKTWRTLRLFTLRSLCLATEQELRWQLFQFWTIRLFQWKSKLELRSLLWVRKHTFCHCLLSCDLKWSRLLLCYVLILESPYVYWVVLLFLFSTGISRLTSLCWLSSGTGLPFLGRNYLEKLKLDWTPYKQLQWNLWLTDTSGTRSFVRYKVSVTGNV